jgi:8-hydroxy-5-deazaflavin:NADPH oxidoreductase
VETCARVELDIPATDQTVVIVLGGALHIGAAATTVTNGQLTWPGRDLGPSHTIAWRTTMKYSIVGSGLVGKTFAGIFARHGVEVHIANSRGPASLAAITAELRPYVVPVTVDGALDSDIIFFAVGFLQFKEVAAKRSDWTGKIVIDVTNAFMLPADVQETGLHGRLSSEVNAERVPGAKLVKAFNQLPMQSLIAPLPDSTGRRVVFVASDHEDASAEVSRLGRAFGLCSNRSRQDCRGRATDSAESGTCLSEFNQIRDVSFFTMVLEGHTLSKETLFRGSDRRNSGNHCLRGFTTLFELPQRSSARFSIACPQEFDDNGY